MTGKKKRIKREPDYQPIAEFLRGKSSQIMRGVEEDDSVVLVTRHGKPMVAVISYERYKELTETGMLVDKGEKGEE